MWQTVATRTSVCQKSSQRATRKYCAPSVGSKYSGGGSTARDILSLAMFIFDGTWGERQRKA